MFKWVGRLEVSEKIVLAVVALLAVKLGYSIGTLL